MNDTLYYVLVKVIYIFINMKTDYLAAFWPLEEDTLNCDQWF